MVTHGRHKHYKYWDKMWSNSRYRSAAHYNDTKYDALKMQLNNRIKRNLLRKCDLFLVEHKIAKLDFLALADNEELTLQKLDKFFKEC